MSESKSKPMDRKPREQSVKDDVTEPEIDDSDDSDEESIHSQASRVRITKEFGENVIKYVKYDDLIKKREQEIKELKEKRKPCEQYIIEYLDKIGENTIDITNGKLKKNKSETKVPLKQEIIKEAITARIADPKIADEIMKLMDEKRPTQVRVNLKRTTKK